MTDPQRHTTLGPRTRKLLEQAGIDKKYLDGIEAGNYSWSIEEARPVLVSASLDDLNKQAREVSGRPRDYKITIYPTEQNEEKWHEFGEDGIAVHAAPRQLGQDIVSTRDREG